jgi:NitT/TauT family transport system substrate-binding protein
LPQHREHCDSVQERVAVPDLGSPHHLFLSSIVTYVGLSPQTDIHWVAHPSAEAMQLLAAGQIDALIGFPPVPQELRAQKIGHVVVNSALDRPWSQYFCCVVGAQSGVRPQAPGRHQARVARHSEGH